MKDGFGSGVLVDKQNYLALIMMFKTLRFLFSTRIYAIYLDPSERLLSIFKSAWQMGGDSKSCSFEDFLECFQHSYMPAALATVDPRSTRRGERWRVKYSKNALRFFINAFLPDEEMRKSQEVQDALKQNDVREYVVMQVRDLNMLGLFQRPWRGDNASAITVGTERTSDRVTENSTQASI